MLEKSINWSIGIYILLIICQIIEVIQLRYESSSSSSSSSTNTSNSFFSSFFSSSSSSSSSKNYLSSSKKTLQYNKKKKKLIFQSNHSYGYFFFLEIIQRIQLQRYLPSSLFYEREIPSDYLSIFIEVENKFQFSSILSYFYLLILDQINQYRYCLHQEIIATEQFPEVIFIFYFFLIVILIFNCLGMELFWYSK